MAAVDVSAVAADVSSQVLSVALIGVAVLLVAAAIRGFRWVRAAIGVSSQDHADWAAREVRLIADYGASEPPSVSPVVPPASAFKGDGSSIIVGGTVFLDPGNSREALAELSEADRFLVEGLMERGRSFGSAMEAVYARNDAVDRADAIRKYAS